MVGIPVAAYIGPPRGLTKHVSTLGIFSKCWVENKIAPGAPFSCQTACLYHGECGGMSCATSRPGPGPGRAGFQLYTCALPLPSWLITGRIPLSPRRNSADSTAGSHASTLVGHTCGWDPRSGMYRAATGPHKTCIDTWNFFLSVGSKIKSRPALCFRAKPLASTMESVGVCHARPQGPGRARAGPVSNFIPSRSRYLPGS